MSLSEFLQKLLDQYNRVRAELHQAEADRSPWSVRKSLWKQADELRLRLDWLREQVEEIVPTEVEPFRSALGKIQFDGHLG